MPSQLNWLGWTRQWCAITSNSADRLLLTLKCKRHYNTNNPFEWMEMISLQGKTNFFEKRVGEYSKSGVGVDSIDQTFCLDSSFWTGRFLFAPSLISRLYVICDGLKLYTKATLLLFRVGTLFATSSHFWFLRLHGNTNKIVTDIVLEVRRVFLE